MAARPPKTAKGTPVTPIPPGFRLVGPDGTGVRVAGGHFFGTVPGWALNVNTSPCDLGFYASGHFLSVRFVLRAEQPMVSGASGQVAQVFRRPRPVG